MASQPPFFPGDLDDHNEDEMHLENTMTRKRTRARPSTAPARGEDSQLRNPYMQTVNEDDDYIGVKGQPANALTHSPEPVISHDWSNFVAAYAAGRWDPHRTPRPPRSTTAPVENARNTDPDTPRSSPGRAQTGPSYPTHRMRNSFSSPSPSAPSHPPPTLPPTSNPSSKPSMTIPIPSATPFTSNALTTPYNHVSSAYSHAPHSSQATAATLRLAGNHVNIAPLALPSPEHELVDPMRGLNTSVPGWSREPETASESRVGHKPIRGTLRRHPTDNDMVTTPDGTVKRLSARLEGLKDFWDGTIQVQESSYTPPVDNDEYFAGPDVEESPEHVDYFTHKSPPNSPPISSAPPSSVPVPDADPLGKRLMLTRHTSAPLPSSLLPFISSLPSDATLADISITVPTPKEDTVLDPIPSLATPAVGSSLTGPVPAGVITSGGRLVLPMHIEEQSYHGRGYLIPPIPANEENRRRALYKFNILNSGADMNFDRIAHLAKLVFNTRGVFVGLVDEDQQWQKSQWGLHLPILSRNESFCGHAILRSDDEPLVVLDTRLDWRFARNPMVVGSPNIRFYAGAPLRTQDGFNIGTLAVIDTVPRPDFSPRNRHTLKEFAAIAMREMELWRDKIQLRIRDRIQTSMEEFSRDCLEIDEETPMGHSSGSNMGSPDTGPPTLSRPLSEDVATLVRNGDMPKHERPVPSPGPSSSSSVPKRSARSASLLSSTMDKVYSDAARLIQRTLDVEGVIVMDVSHCDVLEPTKTFSSSPSGSSEQDFQPSSSDSSVATISTVSNGHRSRKSIASDAASSTVSVTMYYGDPEAETQTKTLTVEEYVRLAEFFSKYPDGQVFEGVVPLGFRMFLPGRMKYALTVPIFNIDKRPFALLCAYNASDHTKRFLEGHELSYLRAIGVIILSAVLKRRMLLADKAKSLFISNISHELRTPLHGILAAAELLTDTVLSSDQQSYLQTVQACGTSLVETVNHVLDFTKLSGNSRSGGVENVIVASNVDLVQLVEEAVDGCWVGHRARAAASGDGIGTFYSPPSQDNSSANSRTHVETVVDVGLRAQGWLVKCERGGIRRVLMNVFGNSLKFTTEGLVHVILREAPRLDDDPSNVVRVELTVHDTGKGISQSFLKNELFHPFSQENPLQTGTGLGLAIVNSIVYSDSVDGKIDVQSEEGVGTEIKITFPVEEAEDSQGEARFLTDAPLSNESSQGLATIVSMVGFDDDHPGIVLLRSVVRTYLMTWWGFKVAGPGEIGQIVIMNEDMQPIAKATESRDVSRPFILLSSLRGSPAVMNIAGEHELIGGFCRVIYKPGGPSRLYAALKQSLHVLKMGLKDQGIAAHEDVPRHHLTGLTQLPPRRNSDETSQHHLLKRPAMLPRSTTAAATVPTWKLNSLPTTDEADEQPDPEVEAEATITVCAGATLLKSSVGAVQRTDHRFKILVVEDNEVLRSLLVKWLKKKGYDYYDAVNGQEGVDTYKTKGPFDVVLLDMSMPVLDGVGATTEIRKIDRQNKEQTPTKASARILALTGMSSLEDKRRAFDAGVDGYLVKPVSFATLDQTFSKLGLTPH